MVRWSAHLGYLYTELPLRERLAAAAADGFTAVEHPAPYEIPAGEMRQRLGDLGLVFSQITSGMGNQANGEKGLASLAGREAEFLEGVSRAIDYAQTIGCSYIHPMAGVPDGDHSKVYRANVAATIQRAKSAGMRVLIEAITIPGYAMGSLENACALQDEFDGNIDLLFDTFHAKALGVDAVKWIADNARRVGHVHVADHPGRHEPGTGNLQFAPILNELFERQYRGAIGFEYVPSRETSETTRFLNIWKQLVTSHGDEK